MLRLLGVLPRGIYHHLQLLISRRLRLWRGQGLLLRLFRQGCLPWSGHCGRGHSLLNLLQPLL